MKTRLALLLLPASACRGEELAEGYVESFGNHLKDFPHAMLVCTFKDYLADEPGSTLYQRYYQEATVVRVFKGDAKVSRKVKFFHLIEGKPKLKPREPGELSFVFFDEMPDGELLLGSGDGFKFHEKFLRLAEAAQQRGERNDAAPTAPAPGSKPEDQRAAKPAAEKRSRY